MSASLQKPYILHVDDTYEFYTVQDNYLEGSLVKYNTSHNNNVNVRESEDWKSFTSAYLDESFLIGYLMPEEYFYFIGELRGVSKREVDRFLNQFEDLFNGEILKGKKYIRDLSKGNQKKVGIVAALIGEPEVIILDEPFANLEPLERSK